MQIYYSTVGAVFDNTQTHKILKTKEKNLNTPEFTSLKSHCCVWSYIYTAIANIKLEGRRKTSFSFCTGIGPGKKKDKDGFFYLINHEEDVYSR